MLTKDLIKRLKVLDPTGETEVVINNDDIQSIELQPSYYDGRAMLFYLNKDGEPQKLSIGHRGYKIQIITFDPETVIVENKNLKIEYNCGNDNLNSKYKDWVEKIRKNNSF